MARVSARFSKSLARRRFRPNQEEVRSTTQRRRRATNPFFVFAPLDDLYAQQQHHRHRSGNLPRVVAAIGPDQFEPRAATAYFVEDQSGLMAVPDRGGVDVGPHRPPFAIDQGVDLAALHLLVGVVTDLGIPTAPFQSDLTD